MARAEESERSLAYGVPVAKILRHANAQPPKLREGGAAGAAQLPERPRRSLAVYVPRAGGHET